MANHRAARQALLLCRRKRAFVAGAAAVSLLLVNMASSIAADAAPKSHGLLLVCNKGDHTLGIIDPETGRSIATVPEDGNTGHEVAASPDGKRAFVPIYGNAGVGREGTDGQLIRVIDLEKNAVVGTIDLSRGARPHCAVFGPKNGLLYVTTELQTSITVIDPATLKILYQVPTGKPESHMLAITSDGRRGYTSNVGSGTVSVLDLENRKLLNIIPVATVAQRIALSVDDARAFTADQTKPQLVVIDTRNDQVTRRIELPGVAYGTAATPDGKSLVVAMNRRNQVGLVELSRMKLLKAVDVPKSPQEVLIRPDGAKAYVSCDASQKIAVIDLRNFAVESLIAAGPGADGLAWAPR